MKRTYYLQAIKSQFEIHPVCAILGPRQAGKMTLAKEYIKEQGLQSVYFDLKNHTDLARLEFPMLALGEFSNTLIVIAEIQRRPDLFPVLRVLVDEHEKKRKFLILGSASRDLIRQSSESLAGRIGYLELPPFTLFEVRDASRLWLRGGFPLSYLADTEEKSYQWREAYITTFLEQDIPNLGFRVPSIQLRRFWQMLVFYHGQIFNASKIGQSLNISHHTSSHYLDILARTFMIRILPPWYENIKKRQVKSPKIYFRDTGILNALIGIVNKENLERHALLGSFWEGFALEQVISALDVNQHDCYFWSTLSGAKLDLLIFKNGKRLGFEIKYTDRPSVTKSMKIAQQDLKLDHLAVVYPGEEIFPLGEKCTAYGFETIATGKFTQTLSKIMR